MLRRVRRAVALALTLTWNMVLYAAQRLRGPLTLDEQALWLQGSCQRMLKALGIRCKVEGTAPTTGLVVANHLSYLDIVIISAAMPCFFVAKMEIGGWPFFGSAARCGGTIFLDRSSLASANVVARIMEERFKTHTPVLLFPEGTSTDGAEVLRFHSRLIDPATKLGVPITTAGLRYVLEDGTPERELCWFGDDPFLPHLMKALGTGGFTAQLRFGQTKLYEDRRTAADQTHAEITAMRHDTDPDKQATLSAAIN